MLNIEEWIDNYTKEILKALYKQSIFVLQAKYFFHNNHYIIKKKDLLDKLEIQDKHILELYFNIKAMNEIDKEKFEQYSNVLFTWSSKLIKNIIFKKLYSKCFILFL